MAKRVVAKQKGRKKDWYKVALPSVLKKGIIGEALAAEPGELIGRTVRTSLRNVLGRSHKHMNAKLRIKSVKNAVAQTVINTLEVSEPYLYRKTRRNSKVCARFTGETKDGEKVELRLYAITYGHALSTVKKKIRKKLEDLMQKKVPELKKEELINNLINKSIQKELNDVVHKIHPMRSVELQKLKIEQEFLKEEDEV